MTDSEPTLLPYIIFSDTTIREAGTGKLSLIGTFERYNLPKFPAQVPPFFVTVRFSNVFGKLEGMKVTMRLEEVGSGHVLRSIGAEINSKNEMDRDQDVEIALPMVGVVFQRAGIYEVTVLVNTEMIGKRKIIVRALTSGSPDFNIEKEK